MTYGVDQCRVCGTHIATMRPQALQEYQDSLRRPTMPEAEWRKQGFLACPTKLQLRQVSYGCCQPCAERLIKRAMGAPKRIAMVGVVVAVVFTIVWSVILFISS